MIGQRHRDYQRRHDGRRTGGRHRSRAQHQNEDADHRKLRRRPQTSSALATGCGSLMINACRFSLRARSNSTNPSRAGRRQTARAIDGVGRAVRLHGPQRRIAVPGSARGYYRPSASIQLDSGRARDRRPFGGFGRDHWASRSGAASPEPAPCLASAARKSASMTATRAASRGLLMSGAGRLAGTISRTSSRPRASARRPPPWSDIGKQWRTLRGGHRQRSDLAAGDERRQHGDVAEQHVDRAAEQVRHRRPGAA